MAEILIIEDDRDMSFTLCRMVEGMGHHATDAFTLTPLFGCKPGPKQLAGSPRGNAFAVV